MNEEELAKQLKHLQELSKENKEIDIAHLSLQALQSYEKNFIPVKEKRMAYAVSILLPPFGIIYAIKFYFSDSDKEDHLEAAFLCVILTFVSIIMTAFLLKAMLSSSPGVGQIQQLTPESIQGLY
jgi:hypothetical protein